VIGARERIGDGLSGLARVQVALALWHIARPRPALSTRAVSPTLATGSTGVRLLFAGGCYSSDASVRECRMESEDQPA
jgi:hypothetical protein